MRVGLALVLVLLAGGCSAIFDGSDIRVIDDRSDASVGDGNGPAHDLAGCPPLAPRPEVVAGCRLYTFDGPISPDLALSPMPGVAHEQRCDMLHITVAAGANQRDFSPYAMNGFRIEVNGTVAGPYKASARFHGAFVSRTAFAGLMASGSNETDLGASAQHLTWVVDYGRYLDQASYLGVSFAYPSDESSLKLHAMIAREPGDDHELTLARTGGAGASSTFNFYAGDVLRGGGTVDPFPGDQRLAFVVGNYPSTPVDGGSVSPEVEVYLEYLLVCAP